MTAFNYAMSGTALGDLDLGRQGHDRTLIYQNLFLRFLRATGPRMTSNSRVFLI